VVRNLRLARVSRKGNKEARLPKVLYNYYRVLKELLYKAITTRKARWEDKSTAKVARINIFIDKRVHKPGIYVYTDLLLVSTELVERYRLVRDVRVDDILL